MVPTFSNFASMQRIFRKNFNWIFEFVAELIAESIDTNFKFQK